MADTLSVPVSLKVGDNITTDHIMPAGAAILPYRSNIPKMSEFCFNVCDPDFSERAKNAGRSIIVGGVNYGQGSSREHAALVPLYLGVRAVVAKSFARIHKDNLINAGILPLTFADSADYDKINEGDVIELSGLHQSLTSGKYKMINKTTNSEIILECALSERQIKIMLAGGLIAATANE